MTTTTTTTTGTTTDGPRRVLVLGSTGSVGTQALDVIAPRPGAVRGGRAGGGRRGRRPCSPPRPGRTGRRGSPSRTRPRPAALRGALRGVEVLAGPDAAERLAATRPPTSSSTASPGPSGSRRRSRRSRRVAPWRSPTRSRSSSAASWCTRAAAPGQIVPVDSEHSAIAQALRRAPTPRCGGSCSRHPAGRSAAAARELAASRRPRRSPTPRGTWARWSPRTPRRW